MNTAEIKINKKSAAALAQIFILVIGIIAISYAIGSQVGEVSALNPETSLVDYLKSKGAGSSVAARAALAEEAGIVSSAAYLEAGGESVARIGYNTDLLASLQQGEAAASPAKVGIWGKFFIGKGGGFFVEGTKWASWAGFKGWAAYSGVVILTSFLTVALIISVAKVLGAGERNMQQIADAAWASGLGVTGISIASAALGFGPPGWVISVTIIAITSIWTAFSFQKYSQEIFRFVPVAWQPEDGGENCEDCNELRYGCSEYQCHSFGRGCELLNQGQGEEYEKCVWISEGDMRPPSISALASVLTNDYKYINAGEISPPDRGVQIFYKDDVIDGCVPPFTGVTLGVKTDEPAECKIDVERRRTYEEMISYMNAGSAVIYNHTLVLPPSTTPSREAMQSVGWDIQEGSEHKFYIRCKDANGNLAPMNFVIEFCVQDGPDTAAPVITGTNYLQESYIKYNQSTAPLEVYTNEPAECKWDHEDLTYDGMRHNMSQCSVNPSDYLYDISFTYGCKGELTGLKDRVENKFYIRCKDKPWMQGISDTQGKRYENRDSYILTLKGTEPIVIDEITINGEESGSTIKESTDPAKVTIQVKTSAGADKGKAICKYDINDNFYDFYNDGNTDYVLTNRQNLWLSPGNHTYDIICIDAGGNSDRETIEFTIERDERLPTVVRAYRESDYLKIITDEEAECVYDVVSCTYNFEDGLAMESHDDISHFIAWDSDKTFYIKCQDMFGNQPNPDECGIRIKPFEV